MKKFIIFIAGGIVGALIAFAVPYFISEEDDNYYQDSLVLFKEIGECVSTSNFKILQVTQGGALALELIDPNFKDLGLPSNLTDLLNLPSGLVVFFKDETGTAYYDGQVVKMPKGMCAKQIGVYKYLTAEETEKTVPVVEIMKK
jgi:hypothetical protein